jgi:hypothetical protein
MENKIIDSLFGPPINQVLKSESNLPYVLFVAGFLGVMYLVYMNNKVETATKKY